MPEPIPLPDPPASLPGLVFVQEPDEADAAVVFVHGLGGDLYTTWGHKGEPATFLTRLAHDLPRVAVAAYGYASGLKRTVDPAKLDIEELARIWAHTLRDDFLDAFRSVAVVCHSLGGVITQAAVHHLLSTEPSWVRRL